MKEAIIHFLTLNVQASHPLVYVALLAIWAVLLVASVMSLRALDISAGAKVAWFCGILFLPVVGLAAYCLLCLTKGDWSFLQMLFSKPKVTKRGNANL